MIAALMQLFILLGEGFSLNGLIIIVGLSASGIGFLGLAVEKSTPRDS